MAKSVYFISCDLTNAVKIGIADDPMARLRQLQTANPGRLILLGTIPGGRAVEAGLHKRFAASSMGGEWFRLTRADIEPIMAGGDFEACDEPQGAMFFIDDDETPWVAAERCGFDPIMAVFDGLPALMNLGVVYFKMTDVIAWHENNPSPWDAETIAAVRGVLAKIRRGETVLA